MAPNKKYLSLEEAAEQLGLQPDELIRLRERGEIRGFADRGTWKFKADEVEEYHRRHQVDSDPDLPLLDFSDDEMEKPSKSTFSRGSMNSDSDVRLVMSDDTKKNVLSGSSAEVPTLDIEKSDSDVRLAEAPAPKKRLTDSDVKIVKPMAGAKSDSDSDVKMIAVSAHDDDSDSDVKLLQTSSSKIDSDSDVRMAQSDSDVKMLGVESSKIDSDSDVYVAKSDSDIRLAPSLDSDSDVQIISKKSGKEDDDSDSDVMLLSGGMKGKGSGSGLLGSEKAPLGDSGISLVGDSGIALAGDSGIKLADSGIRLPSDDSSIKVKEDSGLRLGGDSGIRLALDSGVQLNQPADSGISLEGDSGIRFADSDLTLAGDSGIKLASPSSGNLSGKAGSPSGRKRKPGGSGRLKGGSQDDIESTVPMLLPDESDDFDLDPFTQTIDTEDSGDANLDEFNADDTSEMSSMTDSGQSVVIFEDEEEQGGPAKKKRKKKASSESLFAMDDEQSEALEELEVSDEDLSGDGDFGDLSFDDSNDRANDSFSEGSSQFEMTAQRKAPFVVQEPEWSGGTLMLLLTSLCASIFGAIVSMDLLRTVWASSQDSVVTPGFMSLLGSLWK